MNEKPEYLGNRAYRRKMIALARRLSKRLKHLGHGKHAANGKKFRLTHVNWFKRIAKEMKDNPVAIEAITSRRLDKFI